MYKSNRTVWIPCAFLLLACLALNAPPAHAGDSVTLTIGSVSGEIGSSSVVPIEIVSVGDAPSVIVAFLQYDPLKLGFVSAQSGLLLPEAKIIESFSKDDVLSVIVYGGQETIEDGVFLNLRFDVLSGEEAEVIPLTGIKRSAATPSGEALSTTLLDGLVDLGCVSLEPPLNPDASDGNPLGVLVSWEAPTGAVEYRVFRSETPDSVTAQALSPWVSQLSFLDETAPGPIQSGLGCGGEPIVTNFVYWVKARTEPGCESDFSVPTSGFRGKSTVYALESRQPSQLAMTMLLSPGALDLGPLGLVVLVLLLARRRLNAPRQHDGHAGTRSDMQKLV